MQKLSVMKKTFSLYVLIGAAFILSCNNSTTAGKAASDSSNNMMAEKNFDLNKARNSIDEENKKFTDEVKKGDSVGLASHYASDGMALPPNSEAVKKEGLISLWGSFIRMGVKELRLSTQDVKGNDEMLTETGTYELDGDKNKMLDKGKYVVVWENENGSWKIYRDIFNTSMPESK